MNDMATGYIIGLSIALSIFVVTTIIVLIRRHQKRKQGVGTVIRTNAAVTSATHTAPGGYPVVQIPMDQAGTTTYYQHIYTAPFPVNQNGVQNSTMPIASNQTAMDPGFLKLDPVPYPPQYRTPTEHPAAVAST